MPPKAKKTVKKGKKKAVEDEVSENIQDDDELLNMEANQLGNDQEDLTQEQKDAVHYKKLTSNNPQAPLNITKYSYKERIFKTDDTVDQLVFHYKTDGDLLV
jgi:dynein intermediate chain 1